MLLDEIADMPADMQSKLLRVLQEGQIFRLGASRPIHLDIRILAASNRDLKEMVQEGRFREDLFFRMNIMTIDLPRLVERNGDLWLLADHFIHKYNKAYKKEVHGFAPPARDLLAHYDFPGNIRELENIVARAVALAEGGDHRRQVADDHRPPGIGRGQDAKPGGNGTRWLPCAATPHQPDTIAQIVAGLEDWFSNPSL